MKTRKPAEGGFFCGHRESKKNVAVCNMLYLLQFLSSAIPRIILVLGARAHRLITFPRLQLTLQSRSECILTIFREPAAKV